MVAMKEGEGRTEAITPRSSMEMQSQVSSAATKNYWYVALTSEDDAAEGSKSPHKPLRKGKKGKGGRQPPCQLWQLRTPGEGA